MMVLAAAAAVGTATAVAVVVAAAMTPSIPEDLAARVARATSLPVVAVKDKTLGLEMSVAMRALPVAGPTGVRQVLEVEKPQQEKAGDPSVAHVVA